MSAFEYDPQSIYYGKNQLNSPHFAQNFETEKVYCPTDETCREMVVFPIDDIPDDANVIDLRISKITSIPKEISKFKQLGFLGISGRLVSIPDEIGELTELLRLKLNNNNLTRIPDTIGKLKKLEKLYLENNRLVELPKSIGELENLNHLDVRNNQLTSLPSEMANLTTLIKAHRESLKKYGTNELSYAAKLHDNPYDVLDNELSDKYRYYQGAFFYNKHKTMLVNGYIRDNLIKKHSTSSLGRLPPGISANTLEYLSEREIQHLCFAYPEFCKDTIKYSPGIPRRRNIGYPYPITLPDRVIMPQQPAPQAEPMSPSSAEPMPEPPPLSSLTIAEPMPPMPPSEVDGGKSRKSMSQSKRKGRKSRKSRKSRK